MAADLATLCEYGDALRRAGRGEDAQAALFGAAARARAIGDMALFARAAFGAHRVATLTESSRSGVITLLEEALAALGAERTADSSPARWLLSASLARELADGPDRDLPRAVALASAAAEGAREADDPGVLAYALFALADVRWEPGTAAERLRHRRRAGGRRGRRPRDRTGAGSAPVQARRAARARRPVLHRRARHLHPAGRTGGDPAVPVPGALAPGHGRVPDRPAGDGRPAYRRRRRLRRADRRAGHLGGPGQPASRAGVHPARLDPAERSWPRRAARRSPRPSSPWHLRAWLLIEAGDRDRGGGPGGLDA